MGGELNGVGTTGHTGYRRVFQRPRTAHHNLGVAGLATQKKTQVRRVSPVWFYYRVPIPAPEFAGTTIRYNAPPQQTRAFF